MTVYIGSTANVLECMFGPQDHCAHVQRYRSILKAWGSVGGWHSRQLEKAMLKFKMMMTPAGREWVERMERDHEAWRRNNGRSIDN